MTDTTVQGEVVPETAATAVTLAIAAPAPEPDPDPDPVITLGGPNDWLAAAAEDRRRRHGFRAIAGNRPVQVNRALRFLWERALTGDDDTPRRAAAIVLALPGAPRAERILGIRAADVTPPDLPPDARELLGRLGVDVPGPVIEPTAVTRPAKARRHAKAKPAEDAEAETVNEGGRAE